MKRDWEKIATDYIANGKTIEEIAKTYNIGVRTVERHSSSEGWAEKRRKFAGKVAARARAKAEEQKARRQAETLERVELMTERLAGELEKALADPAQLYWQLVGSGPGKQEERALQKLDTRAAKDFVTCMVGINELLQSLGGTLTARDKEQIKLSRDRLKLDRERFAAAQKESGKDDALRIVVEPPPEAREAEEILAALTPEQKARLRELLEV